MKLKILILLILFYTFSFAQELSNIEDVSMLALNKISVTIGGEFIINGTFPASATERVDEFVTRIYNQYRIALLTTTKDARSHAWLRAEIDEYALNVFSSLIVFL